MPILDEPLRAPEFREGQWLNSEPLSIKNLQGKVVLIDFWDYTCINCLHTLPYVKGWHKRYAKDGLVIVGIHAPEFQFSKQDDLVENGVQKLDLTYPILIDNDYATWQAYANRCWPAKYVIDAQGKVRGYHFGEGDYPQTELLIQQLLYEVNPDLSFPEPLDLFRPEDDMGQACYRPTPELYLGYQRGCFGNTEKQTPENMVHYTLPDHLPDHTVVLEGPWFNGTEFIEFSPNHENTAGKIHVVYEAKSVNLVMNPTGQHPAKIFISEDGMPLSESSWGEDVLRDNDTGLPCILVSEARMYRLINHEDFGRHQLTLKAETAFASGLRAYAFTFVSCAVT